MKITVALYATLSKYLPPDAQNRRATIEVKDGATVRDVLDQLGVAADLPNILLVNGRQSPEATALKDGETLSVFPPLAGGSPPIQPPPAGKCVPPRSIRSNSPGPSGPLICPE
jgi:sulfur carrier protein